MLKSAAGKHAGGACGTIPLEEDGPQSGTLVFLPFIGVMVKNCDVKDAAKNSEKLHVKRFCPCESSSGHRPAAGEGYEVKLGGEWKGKPHKDSSHQPPKEAHQSLLKDIPWR